MELDGSEWRSERRPGIKRMRASVAQRGVGLDVQDAARTRRHRWGQTTSRLPTRWCRRSSWRRATQHLATCAYAEAGNGFAVSVDSGETEVERSPGEDAAATAQSAAKSSGVGGMVSLARTISRAGASAAFLLAVGFGKPNGSLGDGIERVGDGDDSIILIVNLRRPTCVILVV